MKCEVLSMKCEVLNIKYEVSTIPFSLHPLYFSVFSAFILHTFGVWLNLTQIEYCGVYPLSSVG